MTIKNVVQAKCNACGAQAISDDLDVPVGWVGVILSVEGRNEKSVGVGADRAYVHACSHLCVCKILDEFARKCADLFESSEKQVTGDQK